MRLIGEAIFAYVPWRFPRTFGIAEVGIYAFAGSIDFIRRHTAIVSELELLRARLGGELRILDYGGANSPLSTFLRLYGLADSYRVVVADVDSVAIARAALRPPLEAAQVLDPARELPFADGTFDVVVSSDVFEHIPPQDRSRWAAELHRVARYAQVHNIPCDGVGYSSSEADAAYQAWYMARFGTPEPWTAEHIAYGVPTITDLETLFPGARLRGIANADLWLKTMKSEAISSSLPARMARGLRYAFQYRRMEGRPPFKACLLTVLSR